MNKTIEHVLVQSTLCKKVELLLFRQIQHGGLRSEPRPRPVFALTTEMLGLDCSSADPVQGVPYGIVT